MHATRLRVDAMTDPVGIGNPTPTLSWWCEDGVSQSAWRVTAVDHEGTLLWDSGTVAGPDMSVEWAGPAIAPRTRVTWTVQLWDQDGLVGPGRSATFERGLGEGDWTASWISGDYTPRRGRRYPVDYFRTSFDMPSHASEPTVEPEGTPASSVARARLYVTACGLYHATLNGHPVGEDVLTPGITDYRVRVHYQTYDVTQMLRDGGNDLTVELADGWYRGSTGAWSRTNQYGTRTKLLAQLEITLRDGTIHTIGTSPDWQWSNDGPRRFADMKDGEHVDARLVPTFAGHARATSHDVTPTSSPCPPVRRHETFTPSLIRTPSGRVVLDFGQNVAGLVRFRLRARSGQRLRLLAGEMLDADGEFTQANIQLTRGGRATPAQEARYVCADGDNEYETRFAVFGFRYLAVTASRGLTLRAEDFRAVAVYTDMEQTGFFSSSNELLNRFVDATIWSAKGNSVDLPTDCPTRERHGWAGDAQLFAPTAAYLFDYQAFARKYIRDLTDAQRSNGLFTQIAPTGGVDSYMRPMDGSAGWSDAGVLIPWVLYQRYGDRRVLEDNYEAMARFVRFKIGTLGRRSATSRPLHLGRAARDVANWGQSYGEWAQPEDVQAFTWRDFVFPHPEETTAYVAYTARIMAAIARILEHEDDAAFFDAGADRATRGYRALVSAPAFSLDTDRQARLVRPLYMGLLTAGQEAFARWRLKRALDAYEWRLGTGFLSTPWILYVLADTDVEDAYRLLENTRIPGWLAMAEAGATTVWEAWEGPDSTSGGIGSLNHYSKGAVVSWLFDTMCGITVQSPRFFTISPRPGGSFTYACATYDSSYGRVESSWRRAGSGPEGPEGPGQTVTFTITVPPNCEADVHLLDGRSVRQGPGTVTYEVSGASASNGSASQ